MVDQVNLPINSPIIMLTPASASQLAGQSGRKYQASAFLAVIDQSDIGGALQAGWTLYVEGVTPIRTIVAAVVPSIMPPSGFFQNNGVLIIGQAPSASATVSFSATSGAGVTMTFSAATLLGTAADVGRVLTILDTTYKYATITAQSSTTVATVTISGGTLSGTGPFANNAIWLTGTPTTNTTAFSVPLAATFANAWMSFPAGAIAAGVPAAQATVYVQMQSSTVGIAFNNILSPGMVPNAASIPASPTPFVTTGPGAYTQATSIQSIMQPSIPGLAIGPGGRLQISYLFSNNNSAGNKTPQINFGGTGLFTPGAQTTNQSISMLHDVCNQGVNNSQVESAAAGGGLNAVAAAPNRLAIDTSIAQPLDCRIIIAAATDFGQFDYLYAVAYPG